MPDDRDVPMSSSEPTVGDDSHVETVNPEAASNADTVDTEMASELLGAIVDSVPAIPADLALVRAELGKIVAALDERMKMYTDETNEMNEVCMTIVEFVTRTNIHDFRPAMPPWRGLEHRWQPMPPHSK